ncbi:hypothetical protein E4T52_09503 [Aureobasidium sp. EXF-3400]|nr:hypothetical protein E4T52_09503 [Aureobasidium sp. EXF-3400]
MPSVQDFLALLLVNKKVHESAMPEFFHSNHFQFRDMESLKTLLQNISPKGREHMRNVSFHYENLAVAAAGAGLLAQSDHLQKLTLIMAATQNPAGHFTIDSGQCDRGILLNIEQNFPRRAAPAALRTAPYHRVRGGGRRWSPPTRNRGPYQQQLRYRSNNNRYYDEAEQEEDDYFDEDDPFFHPRRGRGFGGPGSNYCQGQYDRGTSFAIEEERRLEEQRQLRFEQRRTIGFRGDRRQQPATRNRGLYQRQLRYRNGSNNHHYYEDEEQEEQEEDEYFDEDDPFFRGNNRRFHYRR